MPGRGQVEETKNNQIANTGESGDETRRVYGFAQASYVPPVWICEPGNAIYGGPCTRCPAYHFHKIQGISSIPKLPLLSEMSPIHNMLTNKVECAVCDQHIHGKEWNLFKSLPILATSVVAEMSRRSKTGPLLFSFWSCQRLFFVKTLHSSACWSTRERENISAWLDTQCFDNETTHQKS